MSEDHRRVEKPKPGTNFALDLWLIGIGIVLIPVGIFLQYQFRPPHLDGSEDTLDRMLFIAPVVLVLGLVLLVRDAILWLRRRR